MSGSTFMSHKWPSRGTERSFFPLCGLREGRLFIAKGAAREKQASFSFEFSPYHTFLLHLIRSTVIGAVGTRLSMPHAQVIVVVAGWGMRLVGLGGARRVLGTGKQHAAARSPIRPSHPHDARGCPPRLEKLLLLMPRAAPHRG